MVEEHSVAVLESSLEVRKTVLRKHISIGYL